MGVFFHATVYDVGNSHGNRSGAGIFKLLLIKKQEEVKGMKAKEELQAWLTEEDGIGVIEVVLILVGILTF